MPCFFFPDSVLLSRSDKQVPPANNVGEEDTEELEEQNDLQGVDAEKRHDSEPISFTALHTCGSLCMFVMHHVCLQKRDRRQPQQQLDFQSRRGTPKRPTAVSSGDESQAALLCLTLSGWRD